MKYLLAFGYLATSIGYSVAYSSGENTHHSSEGSTDTTPHCSGGSVCDWCEHIYPHGKPATLTCPGGTAYDQSAIIYQSNGAYTAMDCCVPEDAGGEAGGEAGTGSCPPTVKADFISAGGGNWEVSIDGQQPANNPPIPVCDGATLQVVIHSDVDLVTHPFVVKYPNGSVALSGGGGNIVMDASQGTYSYECTSHPGMNSTITVLPSSAPQCACDSGGSSHSSGTSSGGDAGGTVAPTTTAAPDAGAGGEASGDAGCSPSNCDGCTSPAEYIEAECCKNCEQR